eukprot:scaffold24494_cov65-Cyclotella_meneghiniana.AAC.1
MTANDARHAGDNQRHVIIYGLGTWRGGGSFYYFMFVYRLNAHRSGATDGATDGVKNKHLHRRSFVSKQFSRSLA